MFQREERRSIMLADFLLKYLHFSPGDWASCLQIVQDSANSNDNLLGAMVWVRFAQLVNKPSDVKQIMMMMMMIILPLLMTASAARVQPDAALRKEPSHLPIAPACDTQPLSGGTVW